MEEKNAAFEQTRWSLVALAAQPGGKEAECALNEICQLYWYPLYAWLRRSGRSPEAAEDLTQDFLLWFIEKRHLEKADASKGKLRSFLLSCLKHYAANQSRKEKRLKRGGGVIHLSVDQKWAEECLKNEPSDTEHTDQYFDRNWARGIFENALGKLKATFEAKNQLARYEVLRPFLTGENCGITLAEVGAKLNAPDSSVKGMVHRMRERFKELLTQEVRDTLLNPDPAETDSELGYLLSILSAA